MVPSLMAAAMLASLVSRMISRPLYDTLSEHMVGRAIGTSRAAHLPPPEAGSGQVTARHRG